MINLMCDRWMSNTDSSLFLEKMDWPGMEPNNGIEIDYAMDFTQQTNIDYIEKNSDLMCGEARYASTDPEIEVT